MPEPFIVEPGSHVRLKSIDPGYTAHYQKKGETKAPLKKLLKEMRRLQGLLYAESKRSLLIILQGMDTCGKDGTIRGVMAGINVQGCDVVNFKVPSVDEAARDFLWRAHKVVPPNGKIGIFNRSHYEDVLVPRVHALVPERVWTQRYQQINDFEKMLVENGTVVLKFFLHISKTEQKERLESRMKDATKQWKIQESDIRDRAYWYDYWEAYEAVFDRCSTEYAPWHIVSANKKWYRNLVIAEFLIKTLKGLDMKYPAPAFDFSKVVIDD